MSCFLFLWLGFAAVEQAKRVLSTAQSTDIVVEALCQDDEKKESKGDKKSYDFKYTLDRAKFEKLNEGFFVRCIDTVKKGTPPCTSPS